MVRKILIFSTAYHPLVGGAEVAVKEITDRITEFEFDLITARFDAKLPKFEKVGNVNVYRIGFGLKTLDKLLLPFLGALKVLTLGRKNKYLCYWCVMASFASGAAYIANFFNRPKVPIVLTLQEGDSELHIKRKRMGLIGLSWKLALKRADHLTVLSQYLKDQAIRFGYKGSVDVVPNGVDVQRFDIEISEKEREEVRRGFGMKKEDIILITSSRLVKKNGVGDVLTALADLDRNTKFLICGEGELEESLKRKVESLKLEDRAIFVGNVPHHLLPKYLKACDIFIRPSLSEGFGLSFVEAMAARLPVIATPVGGIPDFLVDPAKLERSEMRSGMEIQTGYFCEPGNPKSIAEAINRAINDVGKNRIIENAYKMVVEKYDWNLVAKKMNKVFSNSIL